MKVLNLLCEAGHGFEGWFANEADFLSQQSSGMLGCPLCGRTKVQKLPSAPRLNLRGVDPDSCESRQAEGKTQTRLSGGHDAAVRETPPVTQALPADMVRALRQLVSSAKDVGTEFADQALAMHNGLQDRESIRGRATPEQALALLEEGVPVLPLPNWPGLTEPLQ